MKSQAIRMFGGITVRDGMSAETSEHPHLPVLVSEVVEGLVCAPHKVFIDGTVGYGGHSEAILRASAPDGKVIGIDQDEEAISFSKKRLISFGDRVTLIHASFFELREIVNRLDLRQVDGILLDLGVSSVQLTTPERGFSFSSDGPLDMRMDRRRTVQASDLVNGLNAAALEEIFRSFGEERWARRIAGAIVRERQREPIMRTRRLADLVANAIPARFRSRDRHPATRVFQALRIAVNEELEELGKAVREGVMLLKSGGRIGVISFHSLEDRIIKDQFRDLSKACVCPRTFPICVCHRTRLVHVVTKKPICPSEKEIRLNPRSRSAKLRIAEKLSGQA